MNKQTDDQKKAARVQQMMDHGATATTAHEVCDLAEHATAEAFSRVCDSGSTPEVQLLALLEGLGMMATNAAFAHKTNLLGAMFGSEVQQAAAREMFGD